MKFREKLFAFVNLIMKYRIIKNCKRRNYDFGNESQILMCEEKLYDD